MKISKFVTGLTVGVAALTLLAACSSSSSSKSSSGSSTAQKINITLATDSATKPFTYSEGTTLTGYDIEVAKAVFAKLPEYQVKYQIADFNAVMTGITAGTYQVVANDIGWTQDRDAQLYYSSPLSKSNNAVAVKSGTYKKISDLAGKSTEGLPSSNFSKLITDYNATASNKIKLTYVDANTPVASRLNDVATGKIDFLLYDAISLKSIIKDQGLNLKVENVDSNVGDPAHDGYEYMVFNKDAQGKTLQTKVNAVLKELQADGTLKKLSEKYLGGDFVPAATEYK